MCLPAIHPHHVPFVEPIVIQNEVWKDVQHAYSKTEDTVKESTRDALRKFWVKFHESQEERRGYRTAVSAHTHFLAISVTFLSLSFHSF